MAKERYGEALPYLEKAVEAAKASESEAITSAIQADLNSVREQTAKASWSSLGTEGHLLGTRIQAGSGLKQGSTIFRITALLDEGVARMGPEHSG